MEEISPNIFVETNYDGVNVGAILVRQGFVCVDVPSYPSEARDWNARLERRHPRGARFIVLTDGNGDRILNTRYLRAPIVAHQATAEKLSSYEKRYPQQYLDSLIQRNPSFGRELSQSPVDRPSISFSDKMTIFANNLEIRIKHAPGPTPGNVWLFIPEAGVLFTGDSVIVDSIPYIAETSYFDWLESLKSAKDSFSNVRIIIPGRGPVSRPNVIDALIEYLSLVHARIEMHIKAGKSRDELSELVDDLQISLVSDKLITIRQRNQLVLGLQRVYDQIIALRSQLPADKANPVTP